MKCPHCNKAPYPIRNDDGSLNWKNIWRIDVQSIFLVISILLIITGVHQINQQCFEVLEEPCKFVDQFDCTGEYNTYQSPYYKNPIENLTIGFNKNETG